MNIVENTVYNCDCFDLMREMVKQGFVVDWCITDPPYGIGVGSLPYTNGVAIVGKALAKRRDYSLTGSWDNQRVEKKYFDMIMKISKNQIIFGGNYYTDFLPTTKSWVVWDKRVHDIYRNDFADCELAWCSKGVARVFHYLYSGMIQGNMKQKDNRFHPTQKPVEMWCQLLNFYTKEGDIVFDPFAGSFSLMVACHKLKRKYIGCEIDKDYYIKGKNWLDCVKLQISIFD